jgi:prepilin-type N-terminal cleavage/methylation domain-containing protein
MKQSDLAPGDHAHTPARCLEAGFSLPELLIATAIMLIISSTVTTGLLHMTSAQKTIWNRTELHSGVRSATELLQQEVGQAGRVTLPTAVTLAAAVAAGATAATVNSAAGLFNGEQLVVGAGSLSETVTLTAPPVGAAITANSSTGSLGFYYAHATGEPVQVYGGFSSGVVPTNMANGSTATVLKLYGDINGDNNMVYVEYTCDTVNGHLYRNMMPWNTAPPKPVKTASDILLSNIVANPGGTACFTYQEQTVNAVTYVTDVAITLTVQTQQLDPVTRQYQTETKALLNVSPRNVFNVWSLASQGSFFRVQPTPPTIAALLP